MTAAALSMVALAGPAAADAPPPVLTPGYSVDGRPIRARRRGAAYARRTILVVGCIHGNECAGRAVVRALRKRKAPHATQIWTVATANPDGYARQTRQNAHHVDLNRNFDWNFRRQNRPLGTYSGPRPFSEPESRAIRRLVRRIHPDVTIWFHQALDLVDLSSGPDPRVVRRYARLARLRARRLDPLPGLATGWQNKTFPGSTAFVVELPAGPMGPVAIRRNVRAVAAMARR